MTNPQPVFPPELDVDISAIAEAALGTGAQRLGVTQASQLAWLGRSAILALRRFWSTHWEEALQRSGFIAREDGDDSPYAGYEGVMCLLTEVLGHAGPATPILPVDRTLLYFCKRSDYWLFAVDHLSVWNWRSVTITGRSLHNIGVELQGEPTSVYYASPLLVSTDDITILKQRPDYVDSWLNASDGGIGSVREELARELKGQRTSLTEGPVIVP